MKLKLAWTARRTCSTIGGARSTLQHKAVPKDNEDQLPLEMIRLVKKYGRYGYHMIVQLPGVAGWKVNQKKVER